MPLQKLLNHILVFFPKESAGRVGQGASAGNERNTIVQDTDLPLGYFLHGLLRHHPLHAGISPNRTDAAAGSINKNQIEIALILLPQIRYIFDLLNPDI